MPPSTGLRTRVRAELIGEIKDEARRQLAAAGAPGLSLRAVTRALGMASSGIYRYFPSRDDLLTALIIDAYDALGRAAEDADARCARVDVEGRWRSVGHAVRDWALSSPHEYALVYGSPVPGYRAPEDTIGPASRVTLVMAGVVHDAYRAGSLAHLPELGGLPPLPEAVVLETRQLIELALPGVPPEVALRALTAWTQLFGMISFELFGQFNNVIADAGPVFDRSLVEMGRYVGLSPSAPEVRVADTTAIDA
jgi:AcrR family transcriptional regulator